MPVLHRVFDLRVLADRPVPGLTPLPPEPPFDVNVSLGAAPPGFELSHEPIESPWYVSPTRGVHGLPSSRAWRLRDQHSDFFRILYDDGTEWFVDRSGSQIWMRWPSEFSLVDVVPYLLGQALGFAQRLRGITCLHASAILLDGYAIALLGPPRAGKSSTAAAFLQRGYPVLADDVVPVVERAGSFFARAAHPRIWLCADMVEALYGSCDALPRLAPSWEKRYLDLREQPQAFTDRPERLAAIYALSDGELDEREPFARPVTARDALMKLVANTYVNHLLEAELRAREFAFLSRLARAVPVRRLRRRVGLDATSLCDGILHDYRSQVAGGYASLASPNR